MNTKALSILLGAVLVVAIGALVYTQNRGREAGAPSAQVEPASEGGQGNEAASGASGTNGDPSGGNTTAQPSGITRTDVAAHASRGSCWTIINGSVYDLTSWIPNHPGGEAAILQLCGTDGSARFNGQHGGATQQATILAGFRIGALAQ